MEITSFKISNTIIGLEHYNYALLPSRFDNYFTTGTEIYSHYTRAL